MGVLVIGEAGVNHNGDLDTARRLVDAIAEAGADAVKFQTFRTASLVTASAKQAAYQVRNDGDAGGQFAMLQRLELDDDAHHALVAHCAAVGIEFLSSPFDLDSAAFLTDTLGVARVKLGSGEITNGPLLWQVARTGTPLILSTGMSTLDEVEDALRVLAHGYGNVAGRPTREVRARPTLRDVTDVLRDRVTLLHCTSEYPCAPDDVNLRAMATLADAFGLPVGFSDHTEGIDIGPAAVALGAVVVEKHVTLDRGSAGPDHRASIEPDALAALVAAIRRVEAAMGTGAKEPRPIEIATRAVARKSLVAAAPIAAGEIVTEANVTAKRPAGGVSPMDFWDVTDGATVAVESLPPDAPLPEGLRP